MTTIGELLQIPRFSNIQVLNSHADLTKIVDTIEISETPDVAAYLPKNVFLVTTAMVFKDDPKGLCDMLRSLNALPAAGIGIKLGRFINELDPMVLAVADELGFPILQIPSTVTLGTTSHQLLSYLWDTETEKLNFALDIQQKFSNMMIKGATLTSLTRHLGSILKRPVLLINPFLEVVAESRHLQNDPKFSNTTIEKIKPKLREAQSSGKEYSFLLEDEEENPLLVSVFPIMSSAYFPYLLVIFKADQIPYPFSQFAIEQANTVLSYTLYKNLKLTENLLNQKKDFFYQLSEKKLPAEAKLINWLDYGKDYGIIKSSYYRVIIINFEETLLDQTNQQLSDDRSYLSYEWLEKQINLHFKKALLFPIKHTHYYALLLQKSTNLLADKLVAIHNGLIDQLPISLNFSIGNEVTDPASIHFSFREAMDALDISLKEDVQPVVTFFQSKGLNKLIDYVPKEDIEHFCLVNLKSLAFPRSEMNRELRRTLKVYLESQCEITITAKKLFIHRNTVKYRIAKCEELFESPINDPKLSLNLRLALVLSDTEDQI
ncbi:MAG: PucR family transcriptional regulator ligand-binding domain-containing protein [Carnobacterium sp.]|uniref:PucR family transcriptional regulator n=1 Tax=Carnobacterium sp. TaxID=48221 RepID=UPI002FCA057F